MSSSAIGSTLLKVEKWNPKKAPGAKFTYVDLSSVSQTTKSITETAELEREEAPSRARQLIAAGDVLVSTVRPNLNAVAYVPEELSGATASTGFAVLRPDPKFIDPRYLYQWVKTPSFVSRMV